MSDKSLAELAAHMRGIDIAFLSTHTENGNIAGRPMSNNGDVEYDGVSYYFTYEDADTVDEIERNRKVALSFTGRDKFYIFVEGEAELIRDKSAFREHWTPELDKWFDDGIDSPDIVLIKVTAQRIEYWEGTKRGEVKL